jgi:hypothetical protein
MAQRHVSRTRPVDSVPACCSEYEQLEDKWCSPRRDQPHRGFPEDTHVKKWVEFDVLWVRRVNLSVKQRCYSVVQNLLRRLRTAAMKLTMVMP